MLLSRTLAKARIARGERPSWLAAWIPVAADAACLFGLYALIYPHLMSLFETQSVPVWAVVVALFVGGFVPVQIVLIVSSLWAARSRFKDEETS